MDIWLYSGSVRTNNIERPNDVTQLEPSAFAKYLSFIDHRSNIHGNIKVIAPIFVLTYIQLFVMPSDHRFNFLRQIKALFNY